ncbi:MAG: hypothetical protein QNJ30_09675 [Kiloniellales bacterium]|nr:hypothetical protein [Kiloniellales bacterium]
MRSRLFKTTAILALALAAAGGAASAQEASGLRNAGSLSGLVGRGLDRKGARPEGLVEAGLTAKTGRAPLLAQKDGFVATAYLSHARCGADCWTYEMAEDQTALKLAARISFACAPGDAVESLRLVFADGRRREIHDAASGRYLRRFAKTVVLQPWTAAEIRERAGLALGGPWRGAELGQGGNAQSGRVGLRKAVLLEGRCRRDPTPRIGHFQLDSLLAVIDTAWTLPAR